MKQAFNWMKSLSQREDGISIVIVLGFMALSVPLLTAGLALAGGLSIDSRVKSNIAKNQYSSLGAVEYVRYLAEDPEAFDDWVDDTGGEETVTIDDDQIDIDANQDTVSDSAFLDYCIFGNDSVHIKEYANVQCSIGSNGNVDVKEDSTVNGDIVSGGDVVLKENVTVYGDVTAAGTITLNPGAMIMGDMDQGATFTTIASPIVNYLVTFTTTDQDGNQTTETMTLPASLPLTFAVTAGGSDVTVDTGQMHSLPPGSYGTLLVKENATLNLSSGSYAFQEVRIKEDTTINYDVRLGPIIFDVVDIIEFKENVSMAIVSATGTAADVLVRVQNQAQFKEDGQYLGTYFGFELDLTEMHVKERSTLTGALYGEKVEVKENATVNGMPAKDVYLSFWDP